MKVKNIMFSGVMAAILMGASGANAAVEIASKQYVLNQVFDKATTVALESAQTTLQGNIDLKADKNAFETLQSAVNNETTGLATKASTTALNEGLAEKVDLTVYNQHLTDQIARDAAQDKSIDALVGSDGQGGSFAELTTKVETLTGAADVTGSVANQIATSLTDYAKTSYVDSQDAATLQSAKTYADGLATNYDAAGAADTALTDAKAYTDQKVGTLPEGTADVVALVGTKADASTVTTLSETVAGLTNAENGIAATYATKTELKTTDDKAVANAEAIAGIEESDYATSGIDADKVAQIETNKNAITTLNADAQTTGSVDNKVSALLGGVPVSNTCDAQSGLCVLTKGTDGSLVWIDVTNPADAPL